MTYDDDRAPTSVLEPIPIEAPGALHSWRADPPPQWLGHHAPAAGWKDAADSVRRTLTGHKVAFAAAGIVVGAAAAFGGHLARLAADSSHTPPAAASTAPPTGDTAARPTRHTATPRTATPHAHRPAPARAPRPRRTHTASPTPKATKTTAPPSPSPSKTSAPPSPAPTGSSEPPPGSPPPIDKPPGGTE